MKKSFLTAALLLVGLVSHADEIDSNVIHDYSAVTVGYGFLNDVLGDVDNHGVFGGVSYETHNFILAADGQYFTGDDDGLETDAWSAGAGVGYVVRLAENHVNIIPSVGVSYHEAEVSFGPFSASGDTWVVSPGISVSYAFANCCSVAAGYTYSYDVDAEEDQHSFHVGPTFRLCENVGTTLHAIFDTDDGFAGILAGISYHY